MNAPPIVYRVTTSHDRFGPGRAEWDEYAETDDVDSAWDYFVAAQREATAPMCVSLRESQGRWSRNLGFAEVSP